jgi:hypothetical protein
MNICVDPAAGRVSIDQTAYLKDYFNASRVMAKPAVTPSNKNLFEQDTEEKSVYPDEFRSRVMGLMYVAKRSRPDILKEVAYLATKVAAPSTLDDNKLGRLEGYLQSTLSDKLTLKPKNLQLWASVDASYSIHWDSKGHSGMVIGLGDSCCIMARSVKQKLVARSSTESELIALDDALCYILWFRKLLEDLGFKQLVPTVIWQDNKSTILIASKGPGHAGKTRHVRNRYYFIKQHVDEGDVKLNYLPTEEMVSDLLTKPLIGKRFRDLRAKLMGYF